MDFDDPFKMTKEQLRSAEVSLKALIKKAEPARKRFFQDKLNEVVTALKIKK